MHSRVGFGFTYIPDFRSAKSALFLIVATIRSRQSLELSLRS